MNFLWRFFEEAAKSFYFCRFDLHLRHNDEFKVKFSMHTTIKLENKLELIPDRFIRLLT